MHKSTQITFKKEVLIGLFHSVHLKSKTRSEAINKSPRGYPERPNIVIQTYPKVLPVNKVHQLLNICKFIIFKETDVKMI